MLFKFDLTSKLIYLCSDMDVANIKILNNVKHPYQVAPFDEVQVFEQGEAFKLQNGYVRADFSKDGILEVSFKTYICDKFSVHPEQGQQLIAIKVLEVLAYKTRKEVTPGIQSCHLASYDASLASFCLQNSNLASRS